MGNVLNSFPPIKPSGLAYILSALKEGGVDSGQISFYLKENLLKAQVMSVPALDLEIAVLPKPDLVRHDPVLFIYPAAGPDFYLNCDERSLRLRARHVMYESDPYWTSGFQNIMEKSRFAARMHGPPRPGPSFI